MYKRQSCSNIRRKNLTSTDRLPKPYVRTQLAIALAAVRDQPERIRTKKVAGPRPHSSNMYVRTQLAIAVKVLQITNVRQAESIRKKQERNKFINTVKNYAYLLLTTFADPS